MQPGGFFKLIGGKRELIIFSHILFNSHILTFYSGKSILSLKIFKEQQDIGHILKYPGCPGQLSNK